MAWVEFFCGETFKLDLSKVYIMMCDWKAQKFKNNPKYGRNSKPSRVNFIESKSSTQKHFW